MDGELFGKIIRGCFIAAIVVALLIGGAIGFLIRSL